MKGLSGYKNRDSEKFLYTYLLIIFKVTPKQHVFASVVPHFLKARGLKQVTRSTHGPHGGQRWPSLATPNRETVWCKWDNYIQYVLVMHGLSPICSHESHSPRMLVSLLEPTESDVSGWERLPQWLFCFTRWGSSLQQTQNMQIM